MKHLALLAAGASALPAQLSAFERLYDVNTKAFGESATDIISIHDWAVGFGGVPRDAVAVVRLLRGDEPLQVYAMNIRGSMLNAVQPDCPLLVKASDLRWTVDAGHDYRDVSEATVALRDDFMGHLRFTNQDGMIRTVEINGRKRRLADYL